MRVADGMRWLSEDQVLTWWQQIAVGLGLGGGAMLGGVKLGRREKPDPAQRIVDAIRDEAAQTRRAIHQDGERTRETLSHAFSELRGQMGTAAENLARLEGRVGRAS